ncbi:hypothetical protein BpHYR1_006238 [Brachionus plicatilis]|uniref:RNA-directed DNA polymerase from mobile element jockey-like n=1 Tax=Brachionus plicatilis TaxID=10195 RepID=A0A3M7QPT9_BRAPC|nr:hypothetical protein BpHYR1_006238 [Brachionus plicatilis]
MVLMGTIPYRIPVKFQFSQIVFYIIITLNMVKYREFTIIYVKYGEFKVSWQHQIIKYNSNKIQREKLSENKTIKKTDLLGGSDDILPTKTTLSFFLIKSYCLVWSLTFLKVVNDWNSLPVDVVEARSLNCFKSKLDKWLFENRECSDYSLKLFSKQDLASAILQPKYNALQNCIFHQFCNN